MAKQLHLVRVRPTQPNKGIKVQRYCFRSVVYDVDHGWYPVPNPFLARELQRITQREDDPESPKVFDVCTPEEAAEIDRREKTARGSARAVMRARDDAGRSMSAGERPRKSRARITEDLEAAPKPKPPRARAVEPEDEDDADEVGKMDDAAFDVAFEDEDDAVDAEETEIAADGGDELEPEGDAGEAEEVGKEEPPAPKPRAAKAAGEPKKKAKAKPRRARG